MARKLAAVTARTAAALLLAGCGHAAPPTATSTVTVTVTRSSTASSMPEQAAAAAIGQEVRDGNFAFTVTRVDPPAEVVGKRAAHGNWIAVHLRVTNIGNEPHQFWGFNQRLRVADGRVYVNDSMAAAVLNEQQAIQGGDVNPGRSFEHAVVFDVPIGARPATIELHESPATVGVTVKL
jgi:hypothetical protein